MLGNRVFADAITDLDEIKLDLGCAVSPGASIPLRNRKGGDTETPGEEKAM